MTLLWLLQKAKRASIGETRERKDGRTYKKVSPTKWVRLAETKTEAHQSADAWRKAQRHFDYAMTSPLGHVLDEILQKHGVGDFRELVDLVKEKEQGFASKLYRELMDTLRDTPEALPYKRDLADNVGKMLITLRNEYVTAPKTKLTIKKQTGKDKAYYVNPDKKKVTEELPTLKPSVIKAARSALGGWTVTGTLQTGAVKDMLQKGTARLVSGELSDRKAWVMPEKARDLELKYAGDSLKATVRQMKTVKKRRKATATVEISIPYAFAKAFLLKHIKSTRTRNNFIFRLERSKGYREFLEGST